jgi:GNAT superfamily N-acetyltransferase
MTSIAQVEVARSACEYGYQVRIRIGMATMDDIPDILASAGALVVADAGVHDAAATNLGWAAGTGAAYCASLLASRQNLVLLAREGDEVVGHLVGRLSGPGSVHPIRVADLESIHVYPAHRGHGIGGQLMRAFLVWAADNGAQRATVTAYAANAGAQRFYARHGFAIRSVILDRDDLRPYQPGSAADVERADQKL